MSSFNDAILILKPASYKAGTLYSVKPNAAAGDFTVARASTSTRVNSDLKLEEMAINVPLLSYEGGCPHLETHAAYTQILTYSNEFGNSYWDKSGSTIEGDASTAGGELVTNGDFATDTDWVKGTGWTINVGTGTAVSIVTVISPVVFTFPAIS